MTIVITHTYAEGTLLVGTSRADTAKGSPTRAVLDRFGWRWGRSIACWYQRASRDLPARADALTAKAAKTSAEAESRHARARQTLDHIPFGQPMLVDHHSYGADRNRREKAWANMDKSVELARAAERQADRADAAAQHMDRRYNPVTVANRIAKLEAELRRRSLNADYRAKYENELTYWREVRAGQIARGEATDYSRDDIGKGDLVRYRGTWYPVVRANAKTVSLPSIVGGSWSDTAPYFEISDHVEQGSERWAEAAAAAVAHSRLMGRGNQLHPAFAALAEQ